MVAAIPWSCAAGTTCVPTGRWSTSRTRSAPQSIRLIVTATETVASDQPNSSDTGWISTPVLERNAAAATSATNVTAATAQARCRQPRASVRAAVLVTC